MCLYVCALFVFGNVMGTDMSILLIKLLFLIKEKIICVGMNYVDHCTEQVYYIFIFVPLLFYYFKKTPNGL